MKIKKKSLLVLFLFTYLTVEILLDKSLNVSATSYVGGTISTYAQLSDAIIVGEVKQVTDPYFLPKSGLTVLQDAEVDIQEVLKGNLKMTNLTVSHLIEMNSIEGFTINNKQPDLKGKRGLLHEGEKVILFLSKTDDGTYVLTAGPYSKFLIDKDNNVRGLSSYYISLSDLKAKIHTALTNPKQEPNRSGLFYSLNIPQFFQILVFCINNLAGEPFITPA